MHVNLDSAWIVAVLPVLSALTSLTVEACKKILDGLGKKYSSNVLAAVVSTVLSAAVFAGACVFTENTFSLKILVSGIAVAYLGFLTATVGYDKVVQMIGQLKR